jgi:hypothetical protein
LTDAEERLVSAEVGFSLAFLALQRVQGTLTSVHKIEMQRLDDAARGPAFVFRRNSGPERRPPSQSSTSGVLR